MPKRIKEAKLSPSIPKNNKVIQNPFEKENVASPMEDLKRFFKNALLGNLLLLHWDSSYNNDTREFDDATYNKLTSLAETTTEQMMQKISDVVKSAWAAGNKSNKG